MRIFAYCTVLLSVTSVLLGQFPLADRIDGPEAGSAFGAAVEVVADIDQDGVMDYAVGAPFTQGVGVVGVYSGADASLIHVLFGLTFGSEFGQSLARVGDFDSDGKDDLAVGAPLAITGNGAVGEVRIFSSQSGLELLCVEGALVGERFGVSIAGLGDIDGDLHADFAVSAPHADGVLGIEQGRVEIFSGATGASHSVLWGEGAGDLFGEGLSTAGDLNSDGRSEVFIGSRWFDSTFLNNVGKVYVVDLQTNSTLWTRTGEVGGDQLGRSIDGGVDVTGDGVPDLLMGAMQNDYFLDSTPEANIGRVYLHDGATKQLLEVWAGDLAQDRLGARVRFVGDLDGDGRPDLAFGGLTFTLGLGRGVLRVHSSRDGRLLLERFGDQNGDFYGTALSPIGDIDGDNIPEMLVGIAGDTPLAGGQAVGAVEVLRHFGGIRYNSVFQSQSDYELEWKSLIGTTFGFARVAGAPAMAAGFVGVSLLPADIFTAGFPLLINLDPALALVVEPVTFDVMGEWSVPLSLFAPDLDGFSIFAQSLALGMGGDILFSNGLELHFTD